MTEQPTPFRRYYGSHPLHLLTMVSGFALLGYVLATIGPATLWNSGTWWHSIAVWFAAAVIAHDLVLFPVYALADAAIARGAGRARRHPIVNPLNYIRVPALGAALTLVIFLPGIIEQGADTYRAATGQTQQPFLGRWLLLAAAMFAGAAIVYAAKLYFAHRRAHQQTDESC